MCCAVLVAVLKKAKRILTKKLGREPTEAEVTKKAKALVKKDAKNTAEAYNCASAPNNSEATISNPMFTLPTDSAIATTLTTPRTTKNGQPAYACA